MRCPIEINSRYYNNYYYNTGTTKITTGGMPVTVFTNIDTVSCEELQLLRYDWEEVLLQLRQDILSVYYKLRNYNKYEYLC